MSRNSFLSRIFGRGTNEDETRTRSAEEIGTRRSRRGEPEEERQRRGFTVERAAEMIDGLPSDVPRESAVRIVRGTLAVAGIEISELDRSIRARVSKLNSEMEFARNRQKELRERTEEAVRSLEEEIRKARKACDDIVAAEEKKISRASAALKEVRRVRAFFDFLKMEGEQNAGPADQDTQALDTPFDPDKTQVMQRPGPLADTDEPAGGSTEGPTHGATDER